MFWGKIDFELLIIYSDKSSLDSDSKIKGKMGRGNEFQFIK